MVPLYDLFFSYRRMDFMRAEPLLGALAAAGVRVWRDQSDIPENAAISREIKESIAASKALLAFHSTAYARSKACQQELLAAWLAAEVSGTRPLSRVLIVNPEEDLEHIPLLFRDKQAPSISAGSDLSATADAMREHLAAIPDALGAAPIKRPRYYPTTPIYAARFVGRARQLWTLHGQLTASRMQIITGVYGSAVAQVRGLGGNGKTLLAREYVLRFGPDYPGGIFWLNAYGDAPPERGSDSDTRLSKRIHQIRRFSEQLGLATNREASSVETAFWRHIDDADQPALLVIDDLPSGLTQDELERYWVAQSGVMSTLITTRSLEYGSLGASTDLNVLEMDEAFELLSSHRHPDTPNQEAAASGILTEIGQHPLATELAGSYLRTSGEMFVNYLRDLRAHHGEAEDYGSDLHEMLPTGHERSIANTLIKSIRRLGEEGLAFLRIAAVVAAEPISKELIEDTFEVSGRSEPKDYLRRALSQADSLSLAQEAARGQRTVHRLVSRTVRKQFGDLRPVTEAVATALKKRLEDVSDPSAHRRLSADVAHARAVLSGVEALWAPAHAVLARHVGTHDYWAGRYEHAVALLDLSLDACRKLLGEYDPETLNTVSILALALREIGQYESAEMLAGNLVSVGAQMYGNQNSNTWGFRNNFAQIVFARGDYERARQLQEELLVSTRASFGSEHAFTATVLNNLALTLQIEGDLEHSRAALQEALDIRTKVFGPEHPETVMLKHNFSSLQSRMGGSDDAEEAQREVIAELSSVFGPRHPRTLLARSVLADLLGSNGDIDNAVAIQRAVVEDNGKVFGREDINTVRAIQKLGENLRKAREYSGAAGALEEVVAGYDRLLPTGPERRHARSELADALFLAGNFGRAAEVSRDLIGLMISLPPDAMPLLHAKNQLGEILSAAGKLAEARDLQQDVTSRCRRTLGERNINTLRASGNLARTLARLGDSPELMRVDEVLAGSLMAMRGAETPEVLRLLRDVANRRLLANDLKTAEELSSQIRAARQRLKAGHE